jgi:PAS domain S-box-containing protein
MTAAQPGASGITRPFLVALAGAQPVPTVVLDSAGDVITCGPSAEDLVTRESDGTGRVLADDGTNLWAIISGRMDEARPLLDIKLPVRLADGGAAETMLVVAPLRGAAGTLSGAFVLFTSVGAERARSILEEERHEPQAAVSFNDLVQRVCEVVDADYVYLSELEDAHDLDATVVAACDRTGLLEPGHAYVLRSSPDGIIGPRSLAVLPDIAPGTYPESSLLAEGGYRSWVGAALDTPAGERVGILGVLWREPIADPAGTSAAVAVLAHDVADVMAGIVARRELKDSEQRYSAVFEVSSVPILMVEPSTTQIVDASPAACTFYGYTHDEMLSMSILQIDTLSPEDARAELARAAEGTRGFFSQVHRLADGSLRDVEVTTGPVVVEGRRLLYSMVRDITERKRMVAALETSKRDLERIVAQRTEDLLRSNAELQQAGTARDMVFAALAQETRTSLQTVTGFSGLLLEGLAGELSGEQQRQVEMIAEAGRHLTSFISNLLATRRSGESEPESAPEQLDIVELVESVVFGLTSFAEVKGLSMTFLADERPVQIETDRYKVQQILLNLLSNAVRYTTHGGIVVRVLRDSESVVTVSVADTGPGMTKEQLAHLYEGPEHTEPSAGIGLPTSRRLAGTIGAELNVVSTTGHGTVFKLMLPLSASARLAQGDDPEA